jgi:hypothetical protein
VTIALSPLQSDQAANDLGSTDSMGTGSSNPSQEIFALADHHLGNATGRYRTAPSTAALR